MRVVHACSRHVHQSQRTTFESQFSHTMWISGIKLRFTCRDPLLSPFFVFVFCFLWDRISSYSSRYLGTNSSVQAGLELGVFLPQPLEEAYRFVSPCLADWLMYLSPSYPILVSVTGPHYVALVAPELTSKPGWPRTPRGLLASPSWVLGLQGTATISS